MKIKMKMLYSTNGNDIMTLSLTLSHNTSLIYVSFFHYDVIIMIIIIIIIIITSGYVVVYIHSDIHLIYTNMLPLIYPNRMHCLPMYDDGAGIVYVFELLLPSNNSNDDDDDDYDIN